MPNSSSQPRVLEIPRGVLDDEHEVEVRPAVGRCVRTGLRADDEDGQHVLPLLGPVRDGRLEQLRGRVRVRQEPCVELDHALVHAAERELPVRDALVQLPEHRPRVDAGQRTGLRHGLGLDEATEQRRGHARRVDGQDDAGVMGCRPHARGDAVRGRPLLDAVVEHREREIERVRLLADDDHLLADLREQAVRSLGERLAAEPGERLG